MKMFKIDPTQLPSALKTFIKNEKNGHENVEKTLVFRLNSLSSLNSYVANGDIASAFRYLQVCENYSVLNDGLILMKDSWSEE